MCWNVKLLHLEDFAYLPFVKGTSDENERVSELERVMEVVSANDHSPVVNVVNRGRSNELKPINQTGQTQFSCFIK